MTADPTTGDRIGAPRRHAGAHRSLRPLLVAVLGVLVLGIAAVIWLRSGPAANVGVGTVDALISASPGTPSASPSAATPIPSRVRINSGALPTAGSNGVTPVRLSIPAIGVTAGVVPTGVDANGEFSVPPRISTVGWYRYGPGLDASAGSVVIGGHVDSAKQGTGAFFRLRLLKPGDRLTVTGTDGVSRAYRVVAREEYPKTTIRLDRYFSWTGKPRITLITCGGAFDRSARSYLDNVVVTAVPVS